MARFVILCRRLLALVAFGLVRRRRLCTGLVSFKDDFERADGECEREKRTGEGVHSSLIIFTSEAF